MSYGSAKQDQLILFLQFLTQSLDLVDFEISNTTAAGAYLYSTQFRFIISEWATSKSGNAPRQCLTLPPTFCHGPILTDDAEGTAYAQPLIEYNLRVVVALTDPHVTEGIKLYHQLGIPIQAASEVFPPCATEVWFNDFVTKQSHPLRSSIFNFKKYTMNLTTEEPTPVLMVKGHPFETTEVKIRVSVMASPSTVDTQTLTMLLQRIGFKIVPGLRAKTFYSTQPFPKLPVQAILTANGPHRLHDQILKLEEVDRCLTSWRRMETTTVPSIDKRYTVGSKVGHKIYPQRDDPTSPVEWHSEISFTVKLPNDVTPTFCSALTARQYSLIILLKATGVSVENFVLEVPIQFVSAATHTNSAYSPVSTFGPSDVSRREQVHLEQDICKMVYDDQPPRYM